MEKIKHLYQVMLSKLVIVFFWKKEEPIIMEKQEVKPKKSSLKKQDNFGCLFYLGDLLDHLKDYFFAITFLKKWDPDTYNLYKKIGAQILNGDGLLQPYTTHPRLREIRPAFYMLHFNLNDDERDKDKIYPRFMYFRKMTWKMNVQFTKHDLYEVSIFFADKRKGYGVFQFHVSVAPDASMKMLKERIVKYHYPNKRRSGCIPQIMWSEPTFLKELKFESPEWKDRPTEDLALNLFRMIMNSCFNSGDGFQINVADNSNNIATFNINMLRTPYFFKDRKKTVNINGKTKKIFHIVRTHKRKFLGKETYIKTHFRGLRKFVWNGYRVMIQNPKKEIDVKTFQGAGLEVDYSVIPRKDLIDNERLGELIHQERLRDISA